MKIFITGATGVIGRRVVPRLVSTGHQVSAITRTPERRSQIERLGASAVQVDLYSPEALRGAVADHDAVINLATHIPSSAQMFLPGAWAENDRIRRVASANLVDAALASGVERFVQESFALLYPDSGDRWIDESTPVQPARYNRSALDAEAAAQRFTASGRTGVVLRFAAFYGPNDEQVRTIASAVRRGWVPIPGSPDSYFSSVSHDDAAGAVVAALGAPAGIYNVVDDEPMRRREYYGTLAEALGVPPPRFLPGWLVFFFGSLGETLARSLRISNRKLRSLGWELKYPTMREGWRSVITGH